MWFLLFYDPEGNRRILLSTFPRDGIFGTFVSQVYPAPYDEDPTFLAMEKCPEIEKGLLTILRGAAKILRLTSRHHPYTAGTSERRAE
jgi:hypothetical protein